MALTTAQGAALVKGAAPTSPKVVKVEVTRAFCVSGVRLDVGATLEVSEAMARELASTGKAIPYVDKPAPARLAKGLKEKPE